MSTLNSMIGNLEQLNTEELKEVSTKANAIIEARKAGEQRDAMDAIKELAAKHGLVVDVKSDAGNGAKARIPLPPVYANPDDASQTWSGRGARPKWFKAKLEAGVSPESMKI